MRKSLLAFVVLLPAFFGCASQGASPGRAVVAHLKLIATDPPFDGPLSSNATLVATLEYSIEPFREGEFFITAQFDKATPGSTTDSSPLLQRDHPSLPSASGKVQVTHWLGHPWADKRVTRPLRFRYYLHRRVGLTTSDVVAQTEPLMIDVQ